MSEATANEYPFCPTTSLVLVLDNGWSQRSLPGGGWMDIEAMPEPLKVYGLTSIKQEINEPGWRFDAIFRDVGNSSLAQAKTGWDYSAENAAVLYATSAVDYSENQPQVILTTNANESTRVLWRSWTIEMLVRAPKWRSNAEREADMAAHEALMNRGFRASVFPDHWPSVTKPGSIDESLKTSGSRHQHQVDMEAEARGILNENPTDEELRKKGLYRQGMNLDGHIKKND